MVDYHFFSIDKNGQIYGHGWILNMADINCFRAQGVSSYHLIKVPWLQLSAAFDRIFEITESIYFLLREGVKYQRTKNFPYQQ